MNIYWSWDHKQKGSIDFTHLKWSNKYINVLVVFIAYVCACAIACACVSMRMLAILALTLLTPFPLLLLWLMLCCVSVLLWMVNCSSIIYLPIIVHPKWNLFSVNSCCFYDCRKYHSCLSPSFKCDEKRFLLQEAIKGKWTICIQSIDCFVECFQFWCCVTVSSVAHRTDADDGLSTVLNSTQSYSDFRLQQKKKLVIAPHRFLKHSILLTVSVFIPSLPYLSHVCLGKLLSATTQLFQV